MTEEEKTEKVEQKGFLSDKKKKQQEERKQKEQECLVLEEKVKYLQAEMVNYRRRKEEETSQLLRYANQDLLNDLLPTLDNFERAITLDDNNLSDELSKFLMGFKMIYVSMKETLKTYGIEEIDVLGKPFDPSTSEAFLIDQDFEKENNIVLDVMLKGYRLKDRIIRPSAVKVNQLPSVEEKNREEIPENKGEDIYE